MYLVGYDGNQNIHITVDNLFDDFINGTENTIAMFGTDGTVLADSIITQSGASIGVAGAMTVTSDATFSTNIEVEGTADFNGNVNLGDESGDLITQNGTLFLNGPVKDTTDTLGAVDQVLLSDATGELTFTDLADMHVGGAEVVEVPVKNVQGSALVKGDPVYISGSVGASGRLEVQLADASNAAKMPAVGLLKQNLANNAEGFAVVTGKLRNLITDPIDGVNPTENDVIYVKPSGTSGAALTTTKPVYGNFIQNIGKVGRVSTSNDGNLVVSSILRTNDIPNLTPGKLWVGSTGNTIESQTLFVDEANGRLGIGTTTPNQALHVVGHIRVSNNTNTIYSNRFKAVNDGDVTLRANDGYDLILNATTGDNVGIGTASPDVMLDVQPAIANSGLKIRRYNSSGQFIHIHESDGGTHVIEANNNKDFKIKNHGTSSDFAIETGNSERFRIDGATGNVGIGASSPATKLEILSGSGKQLRLSTGATTYWELGRSTSTGHFEITEDSGDTYFLIDKNTGQIQFNEYGSGTFTGTATKNLAVDSSGNIIETEGGVVDGSGTTNYVAKWSDPDTLTDSVIYDSGTNVGIGTASPSQKLDVNGNIELAQYGYIYFGSNTSDQLSLSNSISGSEIRQFGSGNLALHSVSNGISFLSGYSTKATLTSSGNFGIGTTGPTAKLEVNGNMVFTSDTNSLTFGGVVSSPSLQISNSSSESKLMVFSRTLKLDSYNGIEFTAGGYTSVLNNSGRFGLGVTSPASKLQVDGAVQVADDTATATASKAGALRYRTSGNNSYVDMCMQTGPTTYAWVNIVQNNW